MSLGKRKRQEDGDDSNGEDEGTMRALFQRAFEAKFKPLEVSNLPSSEPSAGEEDSPIEDALESDWTGLSGDEEIVEVVAHSTNDTEDGDIAIREKKAFMVCRTSMLRWVISH